VIKQTIKQLIRTLGYDVRYIPPAARKGPPLIDGKPIRDVGFYKPVYFSPWRDSGYGDFARSLRIAAGRTLIIPESLWTLHCLAKQACYIPGDFVECGVYRGGSAAVLADIITRSSPAQKTLHLFDTFSGMPTTDRVRDWHQCGDFSDVSMQAVAEFIGHRNVVKFYPGFMPDTFPENEFPIAFAHIDVDIYQSVLDCCRFVLPRLTLGGMIVFDDYGAPTCPGARQAVDDFFAGTEYVPLALTGGQALVFKSV
jgi:O-methyltransferase